VYQLDFGLGRRVLIIGKHLLGLKRMIFWQGKILCVPNIALNYYILLTCFLISFFLLHAEMVKLKILDWVTQDISKPPINNILTPFTSAKKSRANKFSFIITATRLFESIEQFFSELRRGHTV
jgi:hypothetical protein